MYYLVCSENKGADQLYSYRTADLRLCVRICKSCFSHDAAHMLIGERGGSDSGRVSDSGARGWGFETYLRHVVFLEQDTLLPKSTGNTQEMVAPSRHYRKIVDWDVKPQNKQT